MDFLIKDESSQYYATGYSCDNAVVVALGDARYFITDARYTVEAKETVNGATEVIITSDLMKSVREILRKNAIRRIAYDPLEWRLSDFTRLTEKLPKVSFKPKEGHLARSRAIKTDDEIARLADAAQIGSDAFTMFGAWIREHPEPLNEKRLFFKAMEILTGQGERPVSFEPILAVNANAAKPHALPTSDILEPGDLLLMDAGIKHKRYCSDHYRTVSFGPKMNFGISQYFRNPAHQKVYDLVLKAHDEAIHRVRPGMRAKEVDAIARDIIRDGGYGDYFIHSLGHGVGLDIHEHPFINTRNDMILEENMVFTIEPGIYLPGEFGVRIEDTVVLNASGARIL